MSDAPLPIAVNRPLVGELCARSSITSLTAASAPIAAERPLRYEIAGEEARIVTDKLVDLARPEPPPPSKPPGERSI
jgi:hypothetical protein